MTPDEVRAIVREELAAIDEAKKLTSEVESTLMWANTEHHLEGLLDEVHLPDDLREAFARYLQAMRP